MSAPEPRLARLAVDLRSGHLPLTDYLDALEQHIAAREPEVLAFLPELDRFERLRREAAALAGRFPEPDGRPPLFGVPVGVKDIFHVRGFETRAGSRLPPGRLQGPEAVSVTRLRQAGALILGKTVTTEFAYFSAGPTRNPHNPNHTPGGSSSGSAAAVAAGLCPLTLGSQTIGSTIRPAAFCGVVGFKPSYDRIPRDGVIPLSPSVDHVGLFAQDVAGIRLAAAAEIGDWRVEIEGRDRPVFGVPEGPYLAQAGEEALDHFRSVAGRLTDAGFTIKPLAAMPEFEEIRERHNLLVAAEAAEVHREWFAEFAGLYHPRTAELIRTGQTVARADLELALEGQARLRAELARLMDVAGIDLWITPAAVGPAPHGLESTGDPVMNLPWTHCGLPAVNLPTGWASSGLPLGTQFIGRWRADEELLAWLEAIEAVLQQDSIQAAD
jgi:Asp-tRNA(Asn)/Glu-tRNA(Gln) amidotransferase A subunit family amidase